jgi:hypothetical protein
MCHHVLCDVLVSRSSPEQQAVTTLGSTDPAPLLLLFLSVLCLVSGVGHMAVQLAKALGLYVVGVAGPSNVDWVKQQLGADEVLDYSKQVGHCCLHSCSLAAIAKHSKWPVLLFALAG